MFISLSQRKDSADCPFKWENYAYFLNKGKIMLTVPLNGKIMLTVPLNGKRFGHI